MSHEYCADSWAASRAAIQAAIDERGGVDGIIGFSQGSTAASLFLAEARPRVSFAVLFSGFFPRDESFARLLRDGARTLAPRSLHVMGSSDTFVSTSRSMLLADCFGEGREVYVHGGGHGIPSDKAGRDAVKKFVNESLDGAG